MQKKLSKLTQAIVISSLASGAYAATLEEVVVVAQKRAQSLQDVPVSVSAVDAEKISDAGIVDLQGLSDYVPNFSINETGISTTVTIRGISSGINPGFEQSVGMYNDGIFYGRDQLARIPMFDMERVEILRGPQGILYGKNSIAGAVSQITAKPTEDFEGSITGLYETEHGEQDLRLVLSGPLTEGLSGRLAILDRSMDGFIFNTITKEDEQQEDEQVIRASLQWDINEDITANLKTSRATFEAIGRNLEVYNSVGNPDHLAVLNSSQANQVEGNLDNSVSNNGHTSDNEVDNTTLSVDWQLDGLTLTSVTGVVDYEYDELCDCDFTGAKIFNATKSEEYSQFSQEFRFASELGNTVDYIGGLFYQTNDLDYEDSIRVTDPSVLQSVFQKKADDLGKLLSATADPANNPKIVGLATLNSISVDKVVEALEQKKAGAELMATAYAAGSSTRREFDQDGDLWAVFAQATWNIADNLRLTVGGRYTNETKDASRNQQHITNEGTPLPATAEGLDDAALAKGISLHNAMFSAFAIEPYDKINGDLNDSSFTPLVSGQWDVNDDTMLYATWTKGYKSGGFDARSNAHPDAKILNAGKADADNILKDNPLTGTWKFKPEEVNSFELGSKMVLADGAAELNLAFYRMEYEDLQVSQFDGVLGFNVTNAGEATVQGLEADGRWAVSDNVIVTGSAAYLDFNYDKFPNSQCYFGQDSNSTTYPGLCDVKGERKEYTPELQANIGAVWSDQISNGYYLDAGMDLVYMDDYIYASNLDPKAKQDAFVLVNARVSLANAEDTWEVALIGRNLTDETVINFGGNTPLASVLTGGTGNSYYGFVNRPRNIAVQGTYRF